MTGSNLSRIQGPTRILLALLASSAVFTAGCANMATTAGTANSLTSGATLTGKVHGGNQPVAFATVKLWYAGQGSSSPATVGATTTTANDGAGSFSFVQGGTGANGYTCPGNNPYVYLVATGGNTLNTGDSSVNNTASVFLAPLGQCSTLSSAQFVDMTEVTTVATMAALQQYFNPLSTATALNPVPESFASSGSGQSKQAMGLAFNVIANMVNTTTGTAVTSKTISYGAPYTFGVGAGQAYTVATPETAKINMLANILASCINNANASASNCSTLFSNAAPPDPNATSRPYGTTFTTATDVLQAIYYILTNPTNGSSTKLSALFGLQSAAGAPFQPALTTQPSDWTIAINYSSTSPCGTNGGKFINSAQDLAVDSFGAIWIANNEPGKGNLTEITAFGQPVSCVAVGTGALTGLTIDTKSNIWTADSGAANVYKYVFAANAPTAVTTPAAPFAIAADGLGNIFYSTPSSSTVYTIAQGALSGTASTAVATAVGSNPSRIMVDSSPAVWTTSGSNFITRSTSATPNAGGPYTSTTVSEDGATYGISTSSLLPSINNKNYVWVGNQGTFNEIYLHSGSGTQYASVSNWPSTGLSTPTAVVSDSAQNVYALNNGSNSLFATSITKGQISPATGIVKPAGFLTSGRSMVIDPSGNIWIGMDGTNSITQIVGAAVPVYQPYAAAIAANKFQVAP